MGSHATKGRVHPVDISGEGGGGEEEGVTSMENTGKGNDNENGIDEEEVGDGD